MVITAPGGGVPSHEYLAQEGLNPTPPVQMERSNRKIALPCLLPPFFTLFIIIFCTKYKNFKNTYKNLFDKVINSSITSLPCQSWFRITRPSKGTQGSNLKCKVPKLVSSPPRAIWSGSVLGGVGVTIALSDQARRANCTWPQFLTFDKETRLTEDLNFHSGSINHSLLTPNFHTVSVIRLRPSKGCSVWAHLDLSHGNREFQRRKHTVDNRTIEY